MIMSLCSKRYLCLAWIITALNFLSPAHAQPTFTWEDLCAASVCRGTGHDGVFSVQFSPGGTQLVVQVINPQKPGLYLVKPSGDTQFLSEGHSAVWQPDGHHVLFLHNRDLWSLDTRTMKRNQLTKDWQDIRSPKPSPDGKWIAFASNRSGHQDLWLMPADGSRPAAQLTKGSLPPDELRFGFSWSPDSLHLAYFSNKADLWSDDLWMIDIASGAEKQLTDSVMGRGEPSWSPDGAQIAFYGTPKSGYWYNELADIFVVDTKSAQTRVLTKQITAREPGAPKWSSDAKQLYFPNLSRGEVELWTVASAGGVATRMTHEGGLLHAWDASSNGELFALVRSTATRGREIDVFSGKGGSLQRISHFSTPWQGLVEPQEISYSSVDGTFIQGFVFHPPGFDPALKYPAIVQVHGGGTHSYYNGLNLVEQRLAQLGYVVIAVNYRGGSGFGRAFQDLSTNDWANTQALDAAAAADFIRSQPWSDGKVGIYGYSYGGITSMAAVTRAPDAFDAAVPMAGIYDFAAAYNNKNRLIRLFIKYGHSGVPDEQPGNYAVSNSITKIKDVKTPILLMHGESDSIAPFDQFLMAKAELKRHGKVFEAHSYPDEPHRFRDPKNRVDMYQRLEAWMERWLKTE